MFSQLFRLLSSESKKVTSNVGRALFSKPTFVVVPISLMVAHCDKNSNEEQNAILESVLSDEEKMKRFSHEFCIQEACTESLKSAGALMNATVSSIIKYGEQYRDSLNCLISLTEQSLHSNGIHDELNDCLIICRSSNATTKEEYMKLQSFMESVEKVIENTVATAAKNGAAKDALLLCSNLETAKASIKENLCQLQALEEKYLKVQIEVAKSESKDKENCGCKRT